jgi:hypothetical protein
MLIIAQNYEEHKIFNKVNKYDIQIQGIRNKITKKSQC